MLLTKPPFDIDQPHVWKPRCDTKVSLEDKRYFFAQRAAEVDQRRTLFDRGHALNPMLNPALKYQQQQQQQQQLVNNFHHGNANL